VFVTRDALTSEDLDYARRCVIPYVGHGVMACEVDDIVQEAMISVLRHPGVVRHRRGFITTVVRRRVVDHLRASRERIELKEDVAIAPDSAAGIPGRVTLVEQVLDMPLRTAVVLVLVGCGWTNKEAGELVGVTQGNADQIVSRGRKALRDQQG
jgi:RNA polymerase sigma factor (sigma-70 family)